MATSMHYPCNYGYIPNTLADDGDPVDVLVVTPVPLIPGVVVTCRPLGMLKMDDEAGGDNKLLAVPIDKILSIYTQWKKPEDLNPLRLKTIQHFFEHYKDLEDGKWVKVLGWEAPDALAPKSSAASPTSPPCTPPDQPRLKGCARAARHVLSTPALSAARKSATALAKRGSRSQCAERVATGSRPRAILCSPCAPPSKRRSRGPGTRPAAGSSRPRSAGRARTRCSPSSGPRRRRVRVDGDQRGGDRRAAAPRDEHQPVRRPWSRAMRAKKSRVR